MRRHTLVEYPGLTKEDAERNDSGESSPEDSGTFPSHIILLGIAILMVIILIMGTVAVVTQ